jgi:thiamine biosynthesis protein ThiI
LPFGEIQQQVMLAVPPPLRVVIYRRLMLRIAQGIAERAHAGALVTGEVNRSGCLADAGEHGHDRLGVGFAGIPPAHRHGQGRDYAGGAAASGHFRSPSSRIRIAASSSRPSIPRPKPGAAISTRQERALPIDDFVRQAVESAVVEDFNYPVIKYSATKDV